MGELGSRLRRAREARGLTLEDAERDTRISRRYLQALENEEFDVIPAPVYARGFLRSYSQYLGLDPQEMLALFPRDPYSTGVSSRRASPEPRPATEPAYGAGRPVWRRPAAGGPAGGATGGAPSPPRRFGASPFGSGRAGEEREPIIGVDIGVPRPAAGRRVGAGAAEPARTALVAGVAVGITLFVLALAFLVSRLGDGEAPVPAETPTTGPESSLAQSPTPAASGLDVTPGVVPDVIGQPVEVARAAIAEAGFVVSERTEPSDAPAGTVIDQGPAPGVIAEPGDTVFIVVSEGE